MTDEKVDLVLTRVGRDRVAVMKILFELRGNGLKDAKDAMDAAPNVVARGISREKAEATKAALENAGATATIKPAS